MENEEDLSCIIIEDDNSEDVLKVPIRNFDNHILDQNEISSPNYTGGIIYGGYDDPNESCNYLEELQNGYYMTNFVNDLNPSSELLALERNEVPYAIPKIGTPILSTPSPKLAHVSPSTTICPGSDVVDLTTPTKDFKKSTVLKRSKNIFGEPTSQLKRQKSLPEAERQFSTLERSAELNLSLNDSELVNYLTKTDSSPEILVGFGSRLLDCTEEVFLLDESVSSPPSNYLNTLPKALSLDTLLSKWNPNFDEAEVTTEQLDVPIDQRESILTPRSQARLDKKNKKQELRLEKAALRQRERDISNANKKSVDATQAWQDLTLLFDSQWSLDTKIGQPLIALCEQDGAKVVEDSRMAIPFSLCWELKTTKRYDEARTMFVPLPRPVHLPVLKVLLKWDASELLEWCLFKKDVAKFDVQIVKLSYPNFQTIAIVSGTQSLFRTIRTHVNRGFNSQVRALDGDAAPASRTSRDSSLRSQHELIHIEYFEDFLVQLQLLHDIHIVQLETHTEIIDFIYAMTKEISAIPHRPQETQLFANLPELSTRKSDSAEETWRLILEQIYLVTPTVASAVTQVYPSFAALFSALQTCKSEQQKLALLSEIEVRPPTGRSRRLGDNLASRILKTFTSSDPHISIN